MPVSSNQYEWSPAAQVRDPYAYKPLLENAGLWEGFTTQQDRLYGSDNRGMQVAGDTDWDKLAGYEVGTYTEGDTIYEALRDPSGKIVGTNVYKDSPFTLKDAAIGAGVLAGGYFGANALFGGGLGGASAVGGAAASDGGILSGAGIADFGGAASGLGASEIGGGALTGAGAVGGGSGVGAAGTVGSAGAASAAGGGTFLDSVIEVGGKIFSNNAALTLIGAGISNWNQRDMAEDNRNFQASEAEKNRQWQEQQAAASRRRRAPVGVMPATINVRKGG